MRRLFSFSRSLAPPCNQGLDRSVAPPLSRSSIASPHRRWKESGSAGPSFGKNNVDHACAHIGALIPRGIRLWRPNKERMSHLVLDVAYCAANLVRETSNGRPFSAREIPKPYLIRPWRLIPGQSVGDESHNCRSCWVATREASTGWDVSPHGKTYLTHHVNIPWMLVLHRPVSDHRIAAL